MVRINEGLSVKFFSLIMCLAFAVVGLSGVSNSEGAVYRYRASGGCAGNARAVYGGARGVRS